MGVGYTASPLHRMIFMDMSAMTTRPPVQGSGSPIDEAAVTMGAQVGVGTPRQNSPTVADIVNWSQGLANKYRDQLEETLNWDEQSTFEVSEDVATGGDVWFHYLAAILDQRGASGLSKVIDTSEPLHDEYESVFAEADRRAFGGRFPQLLLGAEVWLPYQRNLMIEEPSWTGKVERYGSVVHLVDEITAVRAAIARLQPSIVRVSEHDPSDKAIVGAWQSSSAILRLAKIAMAKQLPFWTTG